jgi:hypothetical protein
MVLYHALKGKRRAECLAVQWLCGLVTVAFEIMLCAAVDRTSSAPRSSLCGCSGGAKRTLARYKARYNRRFNCLPISPGIIENRPRHIMKGTF